MTIVIRRFRVRLFFRWYDFWVGFYLDQKMKTLYICPIPMFGISIQMLVFELDEYQKIRGMKEILDYIEEYRKMRENDPNDDPGGDPLHEAVESARNITKELKI